MDISTPTNQAVNLILFAVLYPIVFFTTAGMFAKFFYTPFCIFIDAIWSRGRKILARKTTVAS